MSKDKTDPAAPPLGFWVLAGAVAVIAVALRGKVFTDPSLWYDEYYSASWAAMESWGAALEGIHQIDFHPPLYYLQLWIWARVSTDHTWLLMNSLLLGFVAMAGVSYGAWKLHGRGAAFVAAALCAVSTQAVLQSTELRMYVGLMALVPWAAYFAIRVATELEWKPSLWIASTLLTVMVGYTHGAGFLWVATGFFLQGLLIMKRRLFGQNVVRCVTSAAVASVALIPWLLRASERSPGHLKEPTFELLGEVLSEVLSIQSSHLEVSCLLGALLVALVVVSYASDNVGWVLIAAVVTTLGFGVFLSLYRPIIHLRTFLYLVPLGCLALGIMLAGLMARTDKARLFGVIAAIGFFTSSAYASSAKMFKEPKLSVTKRATILLDRMGARQSTVYARLWGDAFAVCWELVGPGSARGPQSKLRCENTQGMRVISDTRFLTAQRGETILELSKNKFPRPLAGFTIVNERKFRAYTIAKHRKGAVRAPRARRKR